VEFQEIFPGIIKFPSSFDVSSGEVENLKDRLNQAFFDNYEFHFGDGGELLYGMNLSGHKIPAEHIFMLPIKLMDDLNFELVDRIETAIYQALLQYVAKYQDVLHSIWWRTLGHFSAYPTGSSLDLHSDNDVNYWPKTKPIDQAALHHVLSCSAVVNDDFEGGNIYFEYYDKEVELTKGDILFFPSNYAATHCVKQIRSGTRFSYVTWFGHGSPNPDIMIVPEYRERNDYRKGKVWMDHLYDDYEQMIKDGQVSLRRAFDRAMDL
jgi:hypothetical protein